MHLQCSAFYLLHVFYHLNLIYKSLKVSPINNRNFCHCMDGATIELSFLNFFRMKNIYIYLMRTAGLSVHILYTRM